MDPLFLEKKNKQNKTKKQPIRQKTPRCELGGYPTKQETTQETTRNFQRTGNKYFLFGVCCVKNNTIQSHVLIHH